MAELNLQRMGTHGPKKCGLMVRARYQERFWQQKDLVDRESAARAFAR